MDKVIVITGASAGIGAELAKLVGNKGAKVVLAARRQPELEKVAAESGANTLVVVADVTKRADVQKVLEAALARFGHIDVWVNNAGRGMTRQAAELTDDDLDEMMLINCKSALYGMQTVLPHFKTRGRGHIINVSSMMGRLPIASIRAAYSAAKHALASLTTNIRVDVRAKHPDIMASMFYPGVVATDFGLNAKYGGPDSRVLPFAQPVDEVARAIEELIEHPRAEAFSRPIYKEQLKAYFSADDVGVIELQPPWTR